MEMRVVLGALLNLFDPPGEAKRRHHAEAVLLGVEDVLFGREGRILCLCGDDLARSVLRRLTEQRARWAREDAEED